VERYGGDRLLLTLSDEELDGALGFIHAEGQRRVPTVAGFSSWGERPPCASICRRTRSPSRCLTAPKCGSMTSTARRY
jgi:hypothetical protein